MQLFQDTSETRKRSFTSAFLIYMTITLNWSIGGWLELLLDSAKWGKWDSVVFRRSPWKSLLGVAHEWALL